MKTLLFTLSAMTLISLSSCSLVKGVLGLPVDVLDLIVDSAGFISDEEGIPLTPENSPVFSEQDTNVQVP